MTRTLIALQLLIGPTALAQTNRAYEAPALPDPLIAIWQKQNGICRGTSGPESETSCDAREVTGEQLYRLGWCYGREGEYGYQMAWHRCGPRSIRPPG